MQIANCCEIVWDDCSRGFHGGEFVSQEIEVFDFSDEKQYVQFTVKEYTSDRTDYFGVECPAWEIIVDLRDVRAEGEICVRYRIGEDYARADYAKEFCDYALASIARHGNISRLPFSELID